MKKKCFVLFVLLLLSISFFGSPSTMLPYKKGSYTLGVTLFPKFDYYSLNIGSYGFTIAPSFSYFVFNNFSISFSLYYQQMYANNSLKDITVNMINASLYARYYFWKSRFFIEGSYNFGYYRCYGDIHYKELINNPAFGVGINGPILNDLGIFSGKISWEYSIKYRIPLGNVPINVYSSISRFAIIYHF
ncbi:MAG: hypothetical protein H6Q25_1661 [Bacteroidetes bacterium]|nr:hypothetical protein [Bacteroidota bacterium]